VARRDRSTMARLLATVTGAGIDVFEAAIRNASMEDVYFALETSFAAEQP
jgi:hypothetical protein